MRINDTVCNRIDYFDILKNNITSNKLFKTFRNNLKTRKVIMKVWNLLTEISAFRDEPRN